MLQKAEKGGDFEHTLPIRAGRGGGDRNSRKVRFKAVVLNLFGKLPF